MLFQSSACLYKISVGLSHHSTASLRKLIESITSYLEFCIAAPEASSFFPQALHFITTGAEPCEFGSSTAFRAVYNEELQLAGHNDLCWALSLCCRQS